MAHPGTHATLHMAGLGLLEAQAPRRVHPNLGALFHHPDFYQPPAWILLRIIWLRKNNLFGYLDSGKIASEKMTSVTRTAQIGKQPASRCMD